ncbi:MAG: class I SAM-dependent methyltransferase [Elainellaceae cyanobacterium]
MDEANQKTYSAAGVVQHYAQLSRLQPAEQAILERFRERLPEMALLDVGVGGGRTTQHFAPLAGEYVGIDSSPEMVAACRRRCPEVERLTVGDARNLSRFADGSFDFVLFSFNGIDYVSHGDRLQILREIHRVGKPGGYLFFSSHSLPGIAPAFSFKTHLSLNPLKTYVNLVMFGLLRLCNPGVTPQHLATADYLILRDESHNFRLKTYYGRPSAQLKQLAFGFEQVEVYSWKRKRASEASDPSLLDSLWLYYLCTVL